MLPYAGSSPANFSSSFLGPTELNQTVTFCFSHGADAEAHVAHANAEAEAFFGLGDGAHFLLEGQGGEVLENGGEIVGGRGAQGPLFGPVQETGGNFSEKTAGGIELPVAVDLAAAGMGEVELFHGAGHSHAAESALLLDILSVVGAGMEEKSFLHTGHENDR